jgi:hypothetical protein
MKKTYLSIVIGIIAIIIIGWVVFFLNTKEIQAPTEIVKTENLDVEAGNLSDGKTQENLENNTDTNTQSLWEQYVSKKIGNITCETKINTGGILMEQVVYISGLKIRMNGVVITKEKTIETYMISDGEYVYLWWAKGMPATKMKIDRVEREAQAKQAGENISKGDISDALKKMDYSRCKEWNVDESLFKAPAGMEFMDISEAIKPENIMKGMKKEDGSPAVSDEEMKKIQEMIKNQDLWNK